MFKILDILELNEVNLLYDSFINKVSYNKLKELYLYTILYFTVWQKVLWEHNSLEN